MVLKDLTSDKHSSRRKILSARGRQLLLKQQPLLPSNSFRFEPKTVDLTVDDLESKLLLEIAAVQPIDEVPPDPPVIDPPINESLGFERLPSDQLRVAFRMLQIEDIFAITNPDR